MDINELVAGWPQEAKKPEIVFESALDPIPGLDEARRRCRVVGDRVVIQGDGMEWSRPLEEFRTAREILAWAEILTFYRWITPMILGEFIRVVSACRGIYLPDVT